MGQSSVLLSVITHLSIVNLGTKIKKKEKSNKTRQSFYFSIFGKKAVTTQALCCTPEMLKSAV